MVLEQELLTPTYVRAPVEFLKFWGLALVRIYGFSLQNHRKNGDNTFLLFFLFFITYKLVEKPGGSSIVNHRWNVSNLDFEILGVSIDLVGFMPEWKVTFIKQ